jgi:hypothetical protein
MRAWGVLRLWKKYQLDLRDASCARKFYAHLRRNLPKKQDEMPLKRSDEISDACWVVRADNGTEFRMPCWTVRSLNVGVGEFVPVTSKDAYAQVSGGRVGFDGSVRFDGSIL